MCCCPSFEKVKGDKDRRSRLAHLLTKPSRLHAPGADAKAQRAHLVPAGKIPLTEEMDSVCNAVQAAPHPMAMRFRRMRMIRFNQLCGCSAAVRLLDSEHEGTQSRAVKDSIINEIEANFATPCPAYRGDLDLRANGHNM